MDTFYDADTDTMQERTRRYVREREQGTLTVDVGERTIERVGDLTLVYPSETHVLGIAGITL